MKKLLIAATICLIAGTNFASAAQAASAHRSHRGASMQSMMSSVMSSGMLSSVGGMIPGGIPGGDATGGLGQSPASTGGLPSSLGSYGTDRF